jgi:hypothetical protein
MLRRTTIARPAILAMMGATLFWGAASAVTAQPASDAPTLAQGLKFVTLTGTFDYAHSGSSQSAQMNWGLAYNRLVTDRVAIGAGLTTQTDWNDYTDTDTSGEISLGPRLFLPSKDARLHPYAALRLGRGFGRDDNPTSFGAGFGLMYLLGSRNRGAGVVGEVLYSVEKYRDDTDQRVMAVLGLTLYFR